MSDREMKSTTQMEPVAIARLLEQDREPRHAKGSSEVPPTARATVEIAPSELLGLLDKSGEPRAHTVPRAATEVDDVFDRETVAMVPLARVAEPARQPAPPPARPSRSWAVIDVVLWLALVALLAATVRA